jgi:hypothetical protein
VSAPETGLKLTSASGMGTNVIVLMDRSRLITANFSHYQRLFVGPCLGDVRDQGFQLALTGDFGTRYEIHATLDLAHWVLMMSLTNLFGSAQYMNAEGTNQSWRFYRALGVP